MKTEREKYEALKELARELAGVYDPRLLLESVVQRAKEVMGAERGFAVLRAPLPEGTAGGVVHTATAGAFGQEATHSLLAISGSAVRLALDEGKSILTIDAPSEPSLRGAESVVLHGIRSVACVPMKVRDRIVGALYLDWKGSAAAMDPDALEFLEALAAQAAVALDAASKVDSLSKENRSLRARIHGQLLGESPAMKKVFRLIERALPTHLPVLILGESGTGKELVARLLHARGPRAGKPFVAQFCGALPETLLESELFGHKKGAFTGALADKKGLFHLADGGTFFLDEVADVPLPTQTKLLRVIEEGEFRPVGSTQAIKVDVRVISATNKDIQEEIRAGRFREDLYYRLNVFTIVMPPLRDRGDDVILLARSFVASFCDEYGLPPKDLSPRAIQALRAYHWPGNVRELRNCIQRAVVISEGELLEPGDLQLEAPQALGEDERLEGIIRRAVLARLERVGGNRTAAAKSLGVSVRWLQYKLKEWHG